MITAKSLRILLSISSALLAAGTAHAWDPNAGADSTSQAILPSSVVPRRFYSDPYAQRPTPPSPAPTYTAAPAYTAPAAPASSVTYYPPVSTGTIPAATPAAGAVAYSTTAPAYADPSSYNPNAAYAAPGSAAAPIEVAPAPAIMASDAPAPMPMSSYPNTPTNSATGGHPRDQHFIGIEGFYDKYKETVDNANFVNNHANYGGIDAGVTHYFDPHYFGTIDGRLSYGEDHYSSADGSASGIGQWESEIRGTAGYAINYGNGRYLKPYLGLGTRYYLDQFKGTVLQDGGEGYDRKIFQLYMPIGTTYEFPAFGLTFSPNIEVDPMLYGHVQSRLQTLGAPFRESNVTQHDGFGARAEFAVSKLAADGTGWQFAPFIRYWNIQDSSDELLFPISPTEGYFVQEPKNNRVQVGANLKYLF